jgi:hypothetical protein
MTWLNLRKVILAGKKKVSPFIMWCKYCKQKEIKSYYQDGYILEVNVCLVNIPLI